jgi:hypothetical protein
MFTSCIHTFSSFFLTVDTRLAQFVVTTYHQGLSWRHMAGCWDRAHSQTASSPGQQLPHPLRCWEPRTHQEAPGGQSLLCGLPSWPTAAHGQPLSENLCGHSLQASLWKGKEVCIILGKAYLLHLPNPHISPASLPLRPPATPSPSSTLSRGLSIVRAFFLSPLLSSQDRVVSLGGKRHVFMVRSCISKVLCWPVMNLPLVMWGNREILWLPPPKLKLMLFLCQWYPRKCFVPFPPLSG